MFRRGGGSGKLCIGLITLLVALAISAIIIIPLVLTRATSKALIVGKIMYSLFLTLLF